MKRILFSLVILFVAIFNFSFAEDINQCKQNYGNIDLYKDLKKAPVSSEDLGRYVGYGGRQIKLPIKLFGNCFSFYKEGKLFCEIVYPNIGKKDYKILLEQLKNKIDKNSSLYDILSGIDFEVSGLQFQKKNANKIVDFTNYINGIVFYVVKQDGGYVYNIPYKFLVPLNVTFNWSLQNLSSYYTDIGFVWLILWILIIFSLIYSIFTKNRILAALNIASIFGYILWWFVGSAILWYGIGIIAWTMFSISVFFYYLYRDSFYKIPVIVFGVFVILTIFLQIFWNFVRISSQGGAGPFGWYKQSNGWYSTKIYSDKTYNKLKEKGLLNLSIDSKIIAWDQIAFIFDIVSNPDKYKSQIRQGKFDEGTKRFIENVLRNSSKIKNLFVKFPYKWKDVFDLQFNHYNRFLDVANSRKDDEGIYLAGTYMRYFINNQRNLYYDHMLVSLWEWMSDGNLCKSYLRIRKDKNIKYIVIDPNIGTVVRFDNASNKTLFDRYFANINLATFQIEEDGVMTNLYKFIKNGFADLYYTNNIAIKYAFVADDKDIVDYLSGMGYKNISDTDILNFRYALLGIRYPWSANLILNITKQKDFRKNIQILGGFLSYLMQKRLANLDIVEDIVDIRGDKINVEKVKNAILQFGKYVKNQDFDNIDTVINDLSDKEREIFKLVLGFYMSKDKNKVIDQLNSFINASILGQSQIFIVSFKD